MNTRKFAASAMGLGLSMVMGYAMADDAALKVKTFAEADTNADGVLSIEEAKRAMPDLRIEDLNGDEIVNRNEVKEALPTIEFDQHDTAPVAAEDYQMIVAAITEESEADIASN